MHHPKKKKKKKWETAIINKWQRSDEHVQTDGITKLLNYNLKIQNKGRILNESPALTSKAIFYMSYLFIYF